MSVTTAPDLSRQMTTRQPWEAPAIVLERPLEARAQEGPPAPPWEQASASFLGPLGTSGGAGNCK